MSQQGSRLSGKVAIITGISTTTTTTTKLLLGNHTNPSKGGGSGFGAAIATRYAQEGAKVVIGDINVTGGQQVASTNPENMSFRKMDVSSLEDWNAVIEYTVQTHGSVDILVNNAGITYRNKVYCHTIHPTILSIHTYQNHIHTYYVCTG